VETLNVPGQDLGVRQRIPSLNPLYPGCPALFIQSGSTDSDIDGTADLIAREGLGLVVTVNVKHRMNRLNRLAKTIKASGGSMRHVLVDADHYSGTNRNVAPQTLSRDWIQAQFDAGCTFATTDSPYIPEGQLEALRSVLLQGKALGPNVLTVLPLHISWLTKRAHILLKEINEVGVPVALVLEHKGDPLGTHAAVDGLVEVLDAAAAAVCLLRSDISTIGAVAFGASLGAIGTTTGLRHNYATDPPKPDEKKPFIPRAAVGAYVPRCMTYRTLEKLNDAIDSDPEHQERWICLCAECGGRTMALIVTEVDAYQHSIASIAEMGDDLLGHLSDPDEMRRSWVAKCRAAQTTNDEVADETGIKWESPGFIGAWQALLPWEEPHTVISV